MAVRSSTDNLNVIYYYKKKMNKIKWRKLNKKYLKKAWNFLYKFYATTHATSYTYDLLLHFYIILIRFGELFELIFIITSHHL